MNAHSFTAKNTGKRTGLRLCSALLALTLALLAVLCSCADGPDTPSGTTGTSTPSGSETTGGVPTDSTPGTPSQSGTDVDPTETGTDPDTTTNTPEPVEPTGFYGKKEGTVYFSPSSIAVDNGKIYVADATNYALYRFSGDGKLEKSVEFEGTASRVRVKDGKVYALTGEYGGKLQILDADLTLERSVTVGHTPTDLYVNGGEVFVCNRFSNTVSVVDLATGRVTAAIPVSREPACMAASGNILYVGSRLQDGSSLDDTISSKIVKIDMTEKKTVGTVALQDGAVNLRSMTATPDGAQIIVSHTVARYAYPTSQLDRGWVNTNGFTVLSTETDEVVGYLLDDLEKGAANPWGTAVSEDGKSLFTAISGTGELIRTDLSKVIDKNYVVINGHSDSVKSLSEIIDRLDYLAGLKTRVTLPGEGAREIAYADGKIYVAEYFSGTVTTIDAKTMKVLSSFAVASQPEKNDVRTGESLWFDARYCYQSWESCSSCHPDARPDGLNWDEGGDGWGTPKNTKSMMFSFRTPPVLATGAVEDAEGNVIGTVREAFHSALPEEQVECMNAFLRSLLPVESPYLAPDGGYTPEALRGKELFESQGCAVCHPAPLYSDLRFHKSPYLGSDGSTEDRPFITPTLVEIWRSAPYTFSGGVTDLSEIIRRFQKDELSESEVSDLKAFLLSIGTVGEYYGVSQVFSEKDGVTFSGLLVPGSKILSFTFYKQIPSVSGTADPVISVVLTDADGAKLAQKTFTPGALVYDVEYRYELGFDVPASAASGTKLTVTVADADGNALASAYVLGCID